MFDFNIQAHRLQLGALAGRRGQPDWDRGLVITAHKLFREAVQRGKLYRLGAALFHHPALLLDLASLKPHLRPGSTHYGGVKAVPVEQIVGSEGRSREFSFAFHPLCERSCPRWVSVAAACLCATPLPPVELIQIGEIYFVRDGHHRISVARAMHKEYIEAEITAWDAQCSNSLEAAQISLRWILQQHRSVWGG